MTNLTKANQELYRRTPDETFATMQSLWEHCYRQREQSTDRWHPPNALSTKVDNHTLLMNMGTDGAFSLTDWSFSGLCRLAGVSKDTVNRLSPATASIVLEETMPRSGTKPLQLLTDEFHIRSIHGASYTRLWNVDLLTMVRECSDFQPPQQAVTGGTGLYCGEQDLFVFLIDPLGWTEVEGENFAPGFFIYNSEVGRRSLGCETFWFQSVCANHIVWDVADVCEYTRKHTANVHDGLAQIRTMIEAIVAKRDARKDGFVEIIRKAAQTKLGDDPEEAFKELIKRNGISRSVAKEAITMAQEKGRFTIWNVVDALTRLSQKSQYAGDRAEVDRKAAEILSLVI